MGIDSNILAVLTLLFLIGGFVFLLLEHLDLKEWRKSVDARFHKLFHLLDNHPRKEKSHGPHDDADED